MADHHLIFDGTALALTAAMVDSIEAAADQLKVAHLESKQYLDGISEVLIKAHDSFAENVERTLREANRQFQSEQANSVQVLSGAIKNLDDVMDDFSSLSKTVPQLSESIKNLDKVVSNLSYRR